MKCTYDIGMSVWLSSCLSV